MSALTAEVWDAAAVGGIWGSPQRGLGGNRRVRHAGAVALSLLLVSVVLALLLSHYRGSAPETAVAILISGGTLSALYLAWVTYRDSQIKAGDQPLAAVADELAVAVSSQWEQEAAVRRLNDPYPLPIRWVPSEPPVSEEWGVLVALASSGAGWPVPARIWASGPEQLAGSGNQLGDALGRVPTGRLVILGEPGSGKTVLMVRLVLDLLKRRHRGDAVPVLVSVGSWNPGAQGFHSWLASQLLIAHPALGAPASASDAGTSRVEALLRAQLIIPILDGFDELPNAVRGPAIAEINGQLRPGERLVLTSRTEEYRQATRPATGQEITLAAAAVELRALDMPDVITYLRQASGGPRNATRWDPVFAALGRPGVLAQVLSNPLMVALARSIYNPRPGEHIGSLPDPGELCLYSSKESIEGHLLDAFIPAAYRSGGERNSIPQMEHEQAERWLSFLARHLDHVVHKPGFAWWELKKASSTINYVLSGAVAGVAAGIPVTLIPALSSFIIYLQPGRHLNLWIVYNATYFSLHLWEWIAAITLFCGIVGSVGGLFVAVGPHRSGQSQSPPARWKVRNAIAGRTFFGLLYGMAYGLIISVAIDRTVGWPDHSGTHPTDRNRGGAGNGTRRWTRGRQRELSHRHHSHDRDQRNVRCAFSIVRGFFPRRVCGRTPGGLGRWTGGHGQGTGPPPPLHINTVEAAKWHHWRDRGWSCDNCPELPWHGLDSTRFDSWHRGWPSDRGPNRP